MSKSATPAPALDPYSDDDFDEDEDEDDFLPSRRAETEPESESEPAPASAERSRKRPRTEEDDAPSAAAVVPRNPPPPQQQQHILWQPSIFGLEPLDAFVKEVGDWIYAWSKGRENVEIEAKIGTLIDTRLPGRKRFFLPVASETILTASDGIRFESNMDMGQHKHYNQILNFRCTESRALPPQARITYKHHREVDSFHPSGRPTGPGRAEGKIRVTRDQGAPPEAPVKAVVEKVRIADLNVYNPKQLFDWRLSVNVEIPHPAPPEGQPVFVRQKDRLSYTQEEMQIDLTQVSGGPREQGQPLHELELEFRRPAYLLDQGARKEQGKPNRYDELLRVFVNNVRMLVRNAPPV